VKNEEFGAVCHDFKKNSDGGGKFFILHSLFFIKFYTFAAEKRPPCAAASNKLNKIITNHGRLSGGYF